VTTTGAFVIAKRYAQALLGVALDADKTDKNDKKVDADEIERELSDIAALLESQPKLADALSTPAIAAETRVAILDEVISGESLTGAVVNLLRLLTSRERMSVFGLIFEQYRKLLLEYKQIQPGEVTSAHPLNDQQQKRLADGLGEALGKTMELTFSNDAQLVGGLVVRVSNRVYDASVIRQLERVKEKALSIL